jgi:hypothetical protein
MNSIDLAKKT